MPAVTYQSAIPATPPAGTAVATTTTSAGLAQHVNAINDLVPHEYDYVKVTSYDANDNPLIIQYRLGGPAGTLQATLTLTWDVSNRFESVYKT